MKKVYLLSALVLIAFQGLAQRHTVNLSGFTKVALGASGTAYITQGNDYSIEIEASDDLFEELEIKVKNDRLVITRDGGWFNWSSEKFTAYITLPEITGLGVSGSGDLIVKNMISTNEIDFSVSGSGDLKAEIEAHRVNTRISGSGSIELNGNCDSNDIRISGSGKLRADELQTDRSKIRISGSGDAYVFAGDEVDISVSGSGDVLVKGDPDKIYSKVSGSGTVKRR